MIKWSKKLNNSSFQTFLCANLTFLVKCYPLFIYHVVENNISMSGNQWIKGWYVDGCIPKISFLGCFELL